MWTKRTDFDDVAVSFGLRNNGYTAEGESWDGVKIYLRRHDGDNFYTAEVNRREGNVIIQRKCDGRYELLGGTRSAATPALHRDWEDVGGTVTNLSDDAVRIQVVRGGDVVLEAVDPARVRATSCASRDGSGFAATGRTSTSTASKCAA